MFNISLALRLAPYVAIAGLCIGLLWYRGEAIDEAAKRKATEVTLTEVRAANVAQQKAIERITAQRAADDALLATVTSTLSDLRTKAEETQASIAELERTNAQVRSYLSTRIPDDLRRMLNRPAARQ